MIALAEIYEMQIIHIDSPDLRAQRLSRTIRFSDVGIGALAGLLALRGSAGAPGGRLCEVKKINKRPADNR